jgi:hypothetical protein
VTRSQEHFALARVVRTVDRMPERLRDALARIFGQSVDDVELVEYSRYARLHRGARATTRRNRILLAGSAEEFFDDVDLVLHEYYHVLKQWNRGRLSVWRYLVEWSRRGYRESRYERHARRFARLRRRTLERHLGRDQPL